MNVSTVLLSLWGMLSAVGFLIVLAIMLRRRLRAPVRIAVAGGPLVRHHGASRRTTVAGMIVVAVFIGAMGAAWAIAPRDVAHEQSAASACTSSGMVVLDLSTSIMNDDLASAAERLEGLVHAENGTKRFGLILASDGTYVMLPPCASAEQWDSVLRFFFPKNRGAVAQDGAKLTYPGNPWATAFRGGTEVIPGLIMAYVTLAKEENDDGAIILVSDLQLFDAEVEKFPLLLDAFAQSGIDFRIIPIEPDPSDLAVVTDRFDARVFSLDPATFRDARLEASRETPRSERTGQSFPFALATLAAAALFALALYGWRGTMVRVRPKRERRELQ